MGDAEQAAPDPPPMEELASGDTVEPPASTVDGEQAGESKGDAGVDGDDVTGEGTAEASTAEEQLEGGATLNSTLPSHTDASELARTIEQSNKQPNIALPNLAREYHNQKHYEWYDKCKGFSLHSQRMYEESVRLRTKNSAFASDQKEKDQELLRFVNMTFRTKLNKNGDLIRKLESGLRANLNEITVMSDMKKQLTKVRDAVQLERNIAIKRIELRNTRAPNEQFEDKLHMALVVNRNDMSQMTDQTNQMLDAMSDMLGRLGLMRQRLTQSFTEKKYAQLIDETCLKMKPEQAPKYPPKLKETIHAKAAGLVGEVAPSMPTAMLMGESAVGRFSYEWLFSKEELALLRAEFDRLAVNDTIAAGDLETLLVNSMVPVETAAADNLMGFVQVHPDNRLNWDLVVKCLADCRGEDNDDVILTGHNWMFKSRRDIDTNLALLNAAGRLRYQACELREYAEATRRKDHQHTQRTMRKQIQETAEHRADTEKRIMEHNLEIRRLEEAERSLSRNFENRAKPLAVSEARYNLRRRRSTREDCHDEVEDALLREVMELQAGVADMQVELDGTRASLAAMRENRAKLEDDYADKTWSLSLLAKCQAMEKMIGPGTTPKKNAFLRGEC